MANEIDDILKRLQAYEGMIGILVINSEGVPIKTTMTNELSVQYSALISNMAEKSRAVIKDLDASNDLIFIRMRSLKYEIMVAPHLEYILIAVQNPVD